MSIPPRQIDTGISALSRRDQNKLIKLRRIKAAARELFLAKSYDEATMREIALRAQVGLGTLFFYAADKRDLLFLIFNDELQLITHSSFDNFPHDQPFLSNITEAFGNHYRLFAKEPIFMRHVLREMTFYSSGPEAQRIQEGRDTIIVGLQAMIANAKATGEIASNAGDRSIADVIFAIYQAQVRLWMESEKPDPMEGLRALRAALRILLDGLRVQGQDAAA